MGGVRFAEGGDDALEPQGGKGWAAVTLCVLSVMTP